VTPAHELKLLNTLTRQLADRMPLETLLGRIVDGAAALLDSPRVSVRLLDPTRTRLLAVARSGAAMHGDAAAEFKLGEGLIGWIAQHGEPIRTDDAERDPRFQPRADQREPLAAFLGVPLVSGRACLGVLSSVHPARGHFTEHHEELLTLVGGICAPHVEVARLQRLSQVDPLTGALNRRGLDQAFPTELEALEAPLSVAMADIDHFKAVNDAWGHAIGDEVLKQVAYVLGAAVRVGDAVVRWGGEEFLLVFPNVDLQAAYSIAERARAAVAAAPAPAAGMSLPVTLSLGVAQHRPGEPRDALVRRADDALYVAKNHGRNRTEMAPR